MTTLPAELTLHSAHVRHIGSPAFYRIAALRQRVFVVEQDCVYLDLDGRDLEPDTLQVWASDAAGNVAATVRILSEEAQQAGLRSIGRVVTDPDWRGRGIAAALMEAAIATCGEHPVVLHAQSHLTDWYGRFGFSADGPEYLEDGIPHTPMRLTAR